MEHFCCECLTFGNIVLVLVFLLILNQLIELYEFRNMPPGPRLTSLPLIGNLLSFDSLAPGESFMDTTKRFVFSITVCVPYTFWVRFFRTFKGIWVLRGVRPQQIPSEVALSRSTSLVANPKLQVSGPSISTALYTTDKDNVLFTWFLPSFLKSEKEVWFIVFTETWKLQICHCGRCCLREGGAGQEICWLCRKATVS